MPAVKLIAVALVANLMIASAAAVVIAPVESSRTALNAYDALPTWLRALLGDDADERTGSDSRQSGTSAGRGPVGSWLEDLYLAALAGDVDAQLALPLDLKTDVLPDVWTAAESVQVSWLSFDSDFHYRVAVTESETPPDLSQDHLFETASANVSVQIPEGSSYLHVQATDGTTDGPVSSAGPFLIDRSPPPTVAFKGGETQTVSDYHYGLEWDPVADLAPIVGYRLEVSRDGVRWMPVAEVGPDVFEHRERNQPNGVYWYRVLAVNAAGLESDPGTSLRLTVDARANLQPPGPGDWNYGLNAVYDSVIHLWDISDPSLYVSVDEFTQAQGHAGLSAEEYARYTAPGWGIELANETLCEIAAQELGGRCVFDAGSPQTTNDDFYRVVDGEENTLTIGLKLFEWLFEAADYDFDKFNDPTGGRFQSAGETLDRGLGICGDLTALYITMMRLAGVPARPVHGYLINPGDGIGGFHMWAEIYVGGDDPLGGWLPVDVSGVTGSFEDSAMLMQFGVANPMYLQLGIQEDLGDADLGEDDERAKWNVWANLQYSYFKNGGSTRPDIDFDANAKIDELDASRGRLWFDPDTHERFFCDGTEQCGPSHVRHYYDDQTGRSVRSIDYGADLHWQDGTVEQITLRLKFPETQAPNQVAIFTPYLHDSHCRASITAPDEIGNGLMEWVISGDQAPCTRS